jgi:hypothetical protein
LTLNQGGSGNGTGSNAANKDQKQNDPTADEK